MSNLLERVLLLKQSEMFSKVSTDDLRYVAQALEETVFFQGDQVFQIHDQGDHMYVIESGRIGISISEDTRSQDYVAILGAGDCFGEMNILDELPRSASAHVIEDSRLLSLEKGRLNGLIMSYPELGAGLIRSLSLRLRDANRRCEQASTKKTDRK